MQAHKIIALLFVAHSQLSMLAGYARADEPKIFQVSVKQEYVQRDPPPVRLIVTVGKYKLTFVAPDGFQVRDIPLTKKIVMTSPDQTCTVNVRFDCDLPGGGDELDLKVYRDLLLSRFPGAKVINEASKSVADKTALIFDLQRTVAGGEVQSIRVAFLPSSAGNIEFTVVGSSRVQQNLDSILTSLCFSGADGQLEIPTHSDLM